MTSSTVDSAATPVLSAVDASIEFPVTTALGRTEIVHALEPTTLALHSGKITALVGESGSGKTTIARIFASMYEPTGGTVYLDGEPVDYKKIDRDYARAVQMVFQDPFGSLNSMKSIRHHLSRALRIHGHVKARSELDTRVHELLEKVKLTPTEEFIDKKPHQLSGGQRQRVSVARALAVSPRVLLADEPISMLDVSMRLDVLNLLRELRDTEGLAILYITHDIASAHYLTDNIYVMYAGQLVEWGDSKTVVAAPRHPYTQELIGAVPDPNAQGRPRLRDALPEPVVIGEPPNLVTPPSGCRFHPRCPHAMDVCTEQFPDATELGPDHTTVCYWVARTRR